MNKKDAVTVFIKAFTGSTSDEYINLLMPVAKTIKLNNKEILFTEGDKAEYIYFVLFGNIKLSKITPNGKETIIRIVTDREIFAEAVLYSMKNYPVTSSALNKTELLALNVEGFRKICLTNAEFVLKMFITMSHQLRYLVDMINDLSSSDTSERLLKYITALTEKKNSKTIKLPVPKRDLAMLLGAVPETISRLFAKLQNEGYISINGKEITLLKTK